DGGRGSVEREIDAASAAGAHRLGELGGDARLAAARHAGDQDTAAAVVALALHHRVEIGNAGGDALVGGRVRQPGRRDGHDADALLVDEERILVGAVRAAAIFHDPQAPRDDMVLHAVVEQDHAVRDVFFQAV